MATVSLRRSYAGSVHEAQSCWCDTSRWPQWVDGLARVVAVEGQWPGEGSSVVWESGPAGRGRVREQVDEYVPLERLVVFIEDERMTAAQAVSFEPAQEGVQVALRLDYSIKLRSPFAPVIERFFVRRPMTISLAKTLEHFGAVLEASRRSGVG